MPTIIAIAATTNILGFNKNTFPHDILNVEIVIIPL
jgi:hypothetical protein